MGLLSVFQDIYNYIFVKNNPKKPNLGEDLRLVLKSSEFEKQLETSAPFLITGLFAWPSYWLYRGLEWQHVRGKMPLNVYIRQTFYRAKVIEICILLTGILIAMRTSHKAYARELKIQEMVQKKL